MGIGRGEGGWGGYFDREGGGGIESLLQGGPPLSYHIKWGDPHPYFAYVFTSGGGVPLLILHTCSLQGEGPPPYSAYVFTLGGGGPLLILHTCSLQGEGAPSLFCIRVHFKGTPPPSSYSAYILTSRGEPHPLPSYYA